MSVRCPRCTRPLAFEDLHLNSKVQGDVSTMGTVHLGEQGEMVGRLICGHLENAGRVDGKVVVYGRAELQAHSLTTGQLSARAVCAHRGATVRLSVKIGPKPLVSAVTGAVTTRPAAACRPAPGRRDDQRRAVQAGGVNRGAKQTKKAADVIRGFRFR